MASQAHHRGSFGWISGSLYFSQNPLWICHEHPWTRCLNSFQICFWQKMRGDNECSLSKCHSQHAEDICFPHLHLNCTRPNSLIKSCGWGGTTKYRPGQRHRLQRTTPVNPELPNLTVRTTVPDLYRCNVYINLSDLRPVCFSHKRVISRVQFRPLWLRAEMLSHPPHPPWPGNSIGRCARAPQVTKRQSGEAGLVKRPDLALVSESTPQDIKKIGIKLP